MAEVPSEASSTGTSSFSVRWTIIRVVRHRFKFTLKTQWLAEFRYTKFRSESDVTRMLGKQKLSP